MTLGQRPGLVLVAAWVAHHAGQWEDVRHLARSLELEALDPLTQAEVLLLEAGRQVAVGDFVDAGRPRMPASPSSRLTNHGRAPGSSSYRAGHGSSRATSKERPKRSSRPPT